MGFIYHITLLKQPPLHINHPFFCMIELRQRKLSFRVISWLSILNISFLLLLLLNLHSIFLVWLILKCFFYKKRFIKKERDEKSQRIQHQSKTRDYLHKKGLPHSSLVFDTEHTPPNDYTLSPRGKPNPSP